MKAVVVILFECPSVPGSGCYGGLYLRLQKGRGPEVQPAEMFLRTTESSSSCRKSLYKGRKKGSSLKVLGGKIPEEHPAVTTRQE